MFFGLCRSSSICFVHGLFFLRSLFQLNPNVAGRWVSQQEQGARRLPASPPSPRISMLKGMNSYIFITRARSAFSVDLGLDKP